MCIRVEKIIVLGVKSKEKSMKQFLQNNVKYIFIGVFIVAGRLVRNKWALKEWEKAQSVYTSFLGILLNVLVIGVCVGVLVVL